MLWSRTQGRAPHPHGTHGWDSHSLPLYQFHVVFGAGIVLIGAQGPPEVGPELTMARKHGSYYLPVNETPVRRGLHPNGPRPTQGRAEAPRPFWGPCIGAVGHLFCSIKIRKVSGFVRTASASRLK